MVYACDVKLCNVCSRDVMLKKKLTHSLHKPFMGEVNAKECQSYRKC